MPRGRSQPIHIMRSARVLTRTNAKDETTTYAYGGQRSSWVSGFDHEPVLFNGVSAITSFGYDSFQARPRRLQIKPINHRMTTDYDKLDRKITVNLSGQRLTNSSNTRTT